MRFTNIFHEPTLAARLPTDGVADFRNDAYQFTQSMELAISAALATQRPLLVTGPAGCGKSSLARSTAARLGWRYLERTVNSRTEVTSLLWDVDQLRRLQDAQTGRLNEQWLAYVNASVLWQALDLRTAADPRSLLEDDPGPGVERLDPAVVLIDEIDKADPDLPNNLLEVLGGLRFGVADTGRYVRCRSGVPLIVITSNDERDLPPAFVRRCISLKLEQPDLRSVALSHFPRQGARIEAALTLFGELAGSTAPLETSVAEFLDFIQACVELQVTPESDAWRMLADACVLKGRAAPR